MTPTTSSKKTSTVSIALTPELADLQARIAACNRCERLRSYCTNIGEVKRKAYRDQTYWARPVPGFGDPKARILILGLAPGAHGANRTGRPFTGDGSGDFMYPVLHELGLASKDQATHREDGLRLRHLWIASVVRCAPPTISPSRRRSVPALPISRKRSRRCRASKSWCA